MSSSTSISPSTKASSLGPSINTSKIMVNICQKGNRVLNYIKNVRWDFATIDPDFVMGTDICALFLSLRYHTLHKDYIYNRIKRVKGYKCRILLVLVDNEHNSHIIQELAKLAIVGDFTMILGWSNQELGRYLETYKAFESKGSEMLKYKPKEDFRGQVLDALTSLRGVNKTDTQVLLENFGSVRAVMNASMEELSLCPGLGEKKVRRLINALHQPFIPDKSKKQQANIKTFASQEEEDEIAQSLQGNKDEEDFGITFDTKRRKSESDSEEEQLLSPNKSTKSEQKTSPNAKTISVDTVSPEK